MNFIIFLSLAISIVLGIPESYDYDLIGGESEFPTIDSVSFFPLCNLYADY